MIDLKLPFPTELLTFLGSLHLCAIALTLNLPLPFTARSLLMLLLLASAIFHSTSFFYQQRPLRLQLNLTTHELALSFSENRQNGILGQHCYLGMGLLLLHIQLETGKSYFLPIIKRNIASHTFSQLARLINEKPPKT